MPRIRWSMYPPGQPVWRLNRTGRMELIAVGDYIIPKRTNEAGVKVPTIPRPSNQNRLRIARAKARKGGEDPNLAMMESSLMYSARTAEQDAMHAGRHCRMYLLHRCVVSAGQDGEFPKEEFAVLGVTGNVFTVTVGQEPRCTCPDASTGRLCKHYFFVLLRILLVDQHNPSLWQRALLKSEASDILSSNTEPDPTVLAPAPVCEAYLKRLQKAKMDAERAAAAALAEELAQLHDVDCPICFATMAATGEHGRAEPLLKCASCGRYVHEDCMKVWEERAADVGVTCVLCRAPWRVKQGPDVSGKSELINIAAEAALYIPSYEERPTPAQGSASTCDAIGDMAMDAANGPVSARANFHENARANAHANARANDDRHSSQHGGSGSRRKRGRSCDLEADPHATRSERLRHCGGRRGRSVDSRISNTPPQVLESHGPAPPSGGAGGRGRRFIRRRGKRRPGHAAAAAVGGGSGAAGSGTGEHQPQRNAAHSLAALLSQMQV